LCPSRTIATGSIASSPATLPCHCCDCMRMAHPRPIKNIIVAHSLVPRGASMINVVRGEDVVDKDLIAACDGSHASAAFFDVFRTQPLPEIHAFWRHPRAPYLGAHPGARQRGAGRRPGRGAQPRGAREGPRGPAVVQLQVAETCRPASWCQVKQRCFRSLGTQVRYPRTQRLQRSLSAASDRSALCSIKLRRTDTRVSRSGTFSVRITPCE